MTALTPEEVAAELRLSMSAVYRGLLSGEIPGQKVCGRWRTSREQLLRRITDGRVPTPRGNGDPMPRESSFRRKLKLVEERRAS